MRILIVDDETDIIRLLEVMLRSAGHQDICSTADSRQVLSIYREFRPDLILLDLMMPHLNGFQVMAQLGPEIPPDTYLPILILTADNSASTKEKALAAGAKDFLTKPFEHFEVLLRIQNLLETRRLYLQLRRQNEVLEEKNQLLEANQLLLQEQMRAIEEHQREVHATLEALRASEERLRLATEAAHLGTWDWHLPGAAIVGESAILKDTQVQFSDPPETFSGSYEIFLDKVHPDDRNHVHQAVMRSVQACTDYDIEFRMIGPDGRIRWMIGRGQTFCDNSGQVIRVLGVVMDVTERKRSEEVLRRYAQSLSNLLKIDQAMLLDRSVQEIADAALEGLRCQLGAHQVGVAEFDLDSKQGIILAVRAQTSTKWGPGARFPLAGDCADSEALLQGEILQVNDCLTLTHPPPVVQNLNGEGVRSYIGLPLVTQNTLIGCLYVSSIKPHAFNDESVEIAREVAGRLAVAIQHSRVHEQLRISRDQLHALSQRLLEAQETERRHIARELHDEIGQTLTTAKVNLQAMRRLAHSELPHLQETIESIDRGLQQVRSMSLELRPSLLDDFGLTDTLMWYIERQTPTAGVPIDFHYDPLPERLPTTLETTCYRLVQEALTNILRHAAANHVQVELRHNNRELSLVITDDGVGFDVEAAHRRAARGGSMGLLSMAERVELAGGHFRISSRPGSGTTICARFPASGLGAGSTPSNATGRHE